MQFNLVQCYNLIQISAIYFVCVRTAHFNYPGVRRLTEFHSYYYITHWLTLEIIVVYYRVSRTGPQRWQQVLSSIGSKWKKTRRDPVSFSRVVMTVKVRMGEEVRVKWGGWMYVGWTTMTDWWDWVEGDMERKITLGMEDCDKLQKCYGTINWSRTKKRVWHFTCSSSAPLLEEQCHWDERKPSLTHHATHSTCIVTDYLQTQTLFLWVVLLPRSLHNFFFWFYCHTASAPNTAIQWLEKLKNRKNWRICYKTVQLEVLLVHNLLPHPTSAKEKTYKG